MRGRMANKLSYSVVRPQLYPDNILYGVLSGWVFNLVKLGWGSGHTSLKYGNTV